MHSKKTRAIYPICYDNTGNKADRIDRCGKTSGIKRSVETYERCKEFIKRNISYEDFEISKSESELEEIDEIVEVMTEVVAFAENPLHINGDYIPADMVRKRFLQIGYKEMDYILFSIERNTSKVRNIRSYLVATVYNAPATLNSYFGAEVRHDFGGA